MCRPAVHIAKRVANRLGTDAEIQKILTTSSSAAIAFREVDLGPPLDDGEGIGGPKEVEFEKLRQLYRNDVPVIVAFLDDNNDVYDDGLVLYKPRLLPTGECSKPEESDILRRLRGEILERQTTDAG